MRLSNDSKVTSLHCSDAVFGNEKGIYPISWLDGLWFNGTFNCSRNPKDSRVRIRPYLE